MRNRGRLSQFGVSSPLKRQYITLCQRIRDRSASGKCRCGVRSVDALDQIKQLGRNATQFSDQILRSFRWRIAFLDLCVYKQSRLSVARLSSGNQRVELVLLLASFSFTSK